MQKGFKKFDKQLVCTGIKSLMKKSNTYNEPCTRRKKLSHSKNLSHLNLIQKKNYLELIQGIFFSL